METAQRRVMKREMTVQTVGVVTGLFGLALAGFPRQTGRCVRGTQMTPRASIVRLLGCRYLAQGAVEAFRPTPQVLKISCGVDALHAASMAATALASPKYRRAACASLLLALTSAMTTGTLARTAA